MNPAMSKSISKWTLFVFTVLTLLGVFSSHSSRAESCATLGEPLFSAVFRIPDKIQNKSQDKYHLIIADPISARKPSPGKKSRNLPTAKITHDTRGCVAQCEFKTMSPVLEGQKMGLELVCYSPHGLPLSSPATLFWAQGADDSGSLRFGTWLTGYQQLPLQVEIDRFLSPPLVANAR